MIEIKFDLIQPKTRQIIILYIVELNNVYFCDDQDPFVKLNIYFDHEKGIGRKKPTSFSFVKRGQTQVIQSDNGPIGSDPIRSDHPTKSDRLPSNESTDESDGKVYIFYYRSTRILINFEDELQLGVASR